MIVYFDCRVFVRNDHTTMTAPLPVCSAKLTIGGPGYYYGGGPRWNPGCCSFATHELFTFFHFRVTYYIYGLYWLFFCHSGVIYVLSLSRHMHLWITLPILEYFFYHFYLIALDIGANRNSPYNNDSTTASCLPANCRDWYLGITPSTTVQEHIGFLAMFFWSIPLWIFDMFWGIMKLLVV